MAEAVNEVPQTSEPLVGSAPRHEPAPVAEAAVTPAPASLRIEWPSDLVQIETDPQKARAAAAAAEEPEPVSRPRRIRPIPVRVPDEPLVQVETRKREAPVDAATPSATGDQREAADTLGHA